MSKRRVPQRGDVYWINPNPTSGREMKSQHRFVVITVKEINQLGVSMTVPVTTAGGFARSMGITVPILGYDTTGVAVCNQVRSFDIQARVAASGARYIETLGSDVYSEIIDRVVSIIDPDELH